MDIDPTDIVVANDKPEGSLNPYSDVFPIYVVKRDSSGKRKIEFSGTGFLVSDGILVTCWHCVIDNLEPNEYYAVLPKTEERRLYPLRQITRHSHKVDMAKAKVNLHCRNRFELVKEEAAIGTLVSFYGYMNSFGCRPQSSCVTGNITPLVSYTDNPYDESYPPPPSYRMDFRAYQGVSGSPVFIKDTNRLIGMIWGHDSGSELIDINEIDLDNTDADLEDMSWTDLFMGRGDDMGANAYTSLAISQLLDVTSI